MAKRKMLFHPDYLRKKIRASKLINRLQNHALGIIDLQMTQIRAIEILLRKSIPDLAAAEIKSDVTHRYVALALMFLCGGGVRANYGGGRRPQSNG
jgi:hypothetical protein